MSLARRVVPLEQRLLLTPAEAAALLGVDYHRVLELIRLGPARGGLASVPVGKVRRVARTELLHWIAREQGAMPL